MNYRSYLYDKDGNKKNRNQRKQEREAVATYNRKLHSKRNKKNKKVEK